jgi:EAL domain-containing protein (putative c-di-GMP-specific phosphodiesterase class I)
VARPRRETVAIVNIDRAKRFAGEIGELGCEVALDDSGAGFGSFYYLKHLTFDYVEIDGRVHRRPAREPHQPTGRSRAVTVEAA